MLLDSFTSNWFQGVKNNVFNWNDVINLLKTGFGPLKPLYKVYRELFETEDVTAPSDVFIYKSRYLKKVDRDKVQNFSKPLKES